MVLMRKIARDKIGTDLMMTPRGIQLLQNWKTRILKRQQTIIIKGTHAQKVKIKAKHKNERTTMKIGYKIKTKRTPTNKNLNKQHSAQLNHLLKFFPKSPRSGIASNYSLLFLMPSSTVKKTFSQGFLVWYLFSPVCESAYSSYLNSLNP